METRFSLMRCMEVINICDGSRLGFVSDLVLDVSCGSICALIIPGPAKVMGLFGKSGDYVVPWSSIRRIGEDIILVEAPDNCCQPKPKKEFRFKKMS